MESYCIDIGKLVAGVGMLLNIFGIYRLYKIDFIGLKIRTLRHEDRPIREDEPVHIILNKLKADNDGILSAEEMEANYLEHINSADLNFKKLKWGFIWIIIGSIMQFISLVIISCINMI